MSDLGSYKQAQDEFFTRLEEAGKDREVAGWIAEMRNRGHDPVAIRRFYAGIVHLLQQRRGMAEPEAKIRP